MRKEGLALLAGCLLWAAPGARGESAFRSLLDLAPAGAFQPLATVQPDMASTEKNPQPAPRGQDLSQEYLADSARIDEVFGPALTADIKGYEILIVPGFLSNHYTAYFENQMTWLRGIGVDCRKVAINTEATPQANARRIAEAVAASTKPVIIVSHSKGSLDALAFFLSRRDLQAKVKGWISIQGALLGSPVADYIIDSPKLDFLAAKLLEMLGGTMESLASLTGAEAWRFYRDHEAAIMEVIHSVPTIAFASWKDPEPGPPNSILAIPRNLMAARGFKNDGLMPVANAVLPGMDFVMVPGVDHADPAMRSIRDFDRLRLTKTLLAMLLRRMKPGA